MFRETILLYYKMVIILELGCSLSNDHYEVTMIQADLFQAAEELGLLDQLLTESSLYKSSKDYLELLDFVSKCPNFAPFNAILLHIQKPGLNYAASAYEWRTRFGRKLKYGARPLHILWLFGPVALVYDVQDTEGTPLPDSYMLFSASGLMDQEMIKSFAVRLNKENIRCEWFDAGHNRAGSIMAGESLTLSNGDSRNYIIHMNLNHTPAIQFCTLAHELRHLFLGHLGADQKLVRRQHSPDRLS